MIKTGYPRAEIQELFVGVDITVVITVDGIKVGIESQGDPNSRLFGSLEHFVQINCQLIICATRTSGRTVNAVNDLSNTYEVKWLAKTRTLNPEKWEASNSSVAQEIFSTVQLVIDA